MGVLHPETLYWHFFPRGIPPKESFAKSCGGHILSGYGESSDSWAESDCGHNGSWNLFLVFLWFIEKPAVL
jgi:hypothetical protein